MRKVILGILICLSLLLSVPAQTPVMPGKAAPNFLLKDLNGRSHSLEAYRGKTVAVAFLSTECPFSNAYHDRLRAIAREYAKQNIVLLGINAHPAEPIDAIRAHAQKKPVAKRKPAGKAALPGFKPQVALLKPEEFAKFKDSTKGQVLVINFWATWCGPCVAEFPEFIALDAKYREKGVKIVGISADEVSDLKTKVIAFLKAQKAPFQNFVQDTDDPQQMIDVVDKEWPGVLPATFIFDKQGALVYKRYGIINRDEVVAAIESAMK